MAEDWNEYFINRWDKVRVFKCGHVVEMSYVQGLNDKATVLRIDKDHYIVVGPVYHSLGQVIGSVSGFFTGRA